MKHSENAPGCNRGSEPSIAEPNLSTCYQAGGLSLPLALIEAQASGITKAFAMVSAERVVAAVARYIRAIAGTARDTEAIIETAAKQLGANEIEGAETVIARVFSQEQGVNPEEALHDLLEVGGTPLIPGKIANKFTQNGSHVYCDGKLVSNFVVQIRRDVAVEVDREISRYYDLHCWLQDGEEVSFRVPHDAVEDSRKAPLTLTKYLGSAASIQPRQAANVMLAAKHFSSPERRREVGVTGFHTVDGRRVFVTPFATIGAPPNLRLHYDAARYGTFVRQYEVPRVPVADARQRAVDGLLHSLRHCPVPDLQYLLASHVLASPIVEMLDTKTRALVQLIGSSGGFKTTFAQIQQRPFGNFGTQAPLSFTSTVNALEPALAIPRGLSALADDLKQVYVKDRDFARLVQAYSAQQSRGRLDPKLREYVPGAVVRSNLIITGETSIQGETSAEARMLTLSVPRGAISTAFLDQVETYRTVMPHLGSYLLNVLVSRFDEAKRWLNDKFAQLRKHISTQVPAGTHARVPETVALVLMGLSSLLELLVADGLLDNATASHHAQCLIQHGVIAARAQADAVAEQGPAEVFIETLNAELASRDDLWLDEVPAGKKGQVVGYKRGNGEVSLCATVSYRVVKEALHRAGRPLHFPPKAIWQDAFERGLISTAKPTPRRFGPRSERVVIANAYCVIQK